MANIRATDDTYRQFIKHGDANSSGMLYPPLLNIVNKQANYTILPTDPCGTCFTNGGDNGAIVFTLPAPTVNLLGKWFLFHNIVTTEQDMTVATATADTMITKNDVAADSVAMSTTGEKIGGLAIAICVDADGAGTYKWSVTGLSVGHTFTVATA